MFVGENVRATACELGKSERVRLGANQIASFLVSIIRHLSECRNKFCRLDVRHYLFHCDIWPHYVI